MGLRIGQIRTSLFLGFFEGKSFPDGMKNQKPTAFRQPVSGNRVVFRIRGFIAPP